MEPRRTETLSRDRLLSLFEQWECKHPLHTHPWLDMVLNDNMNDPELVKLLVEVFYVFCERFHDCGWSIGNRLRRVRIANAEQIRAALAANLHDEYGGGILTEAHLFLMRKLLHSLGYTDDHIRNIEINRGAQHFMDEILRICDQEDPIVAIGCVFVGAECNGARYFRKIYEAFKKKSCLQNADLYILEIHAHDDLEHRERMMKLIDPFLNDPEARALLHYGFSLSIHLFEQLWTSMALYQPQAQKRHNPVISAAPTISEEMGP